MGFDRNARQARLHLRSPSSGDEQPTTEREAVVLEKLIALFGKLASLDAGRCLEVSYVLARTVAQR
jgi:hypothetical protein